MKKSVNGKTFDEIFAQRGKEIKVEKMEKGGVYLLVRPKKEYNWLFEFYSFIPMKNNVEVIGVVCISSDDATFYMRKPEDMFGLLKSELGNVYEASPDQIALLDAYKNNEP